MVKWPRDTSTYANSVGDNFKSNLKQVAATFATHERVDSVSKKHVDESYSALSRMGLRSKRWCERSDTWTGLGAFGVGISFSMPDLIGAIGNSATWSETAIHFGSVSAFAVCLFLSLGLFFWALHRGSLPKKNGTA
ncbi:hypothetical protein ACFL2H_00415 [Planctomycetota bacterium]